MKPHSRVMQRHLVQGSALIKAVQLKKPSPAMQWAGQAAHCAYSFSLFNLRWRTAVARFSSTFTLASQSMQPSVTDCP
jgi:hypothetical protein